MIRHPRFLCLLPLLAFCVPAIAQVDPNDPEVFGVAIDTSGAVTFRQKDAAAELAKYRGKKAPDASTPDKLSYISLKKTLDQARELAKGGKPLPDEIRYLGGLTHLRYVLVYPEEKDIVIAGPAEPIDATRPLTPRGKISGRPTLQLDDLVVALRRSEKGGAFGCSIDPPPNAVERSQQALKQTGSRDRVALMNALKQAWGPQQVRVFGADADSRFLFVCVAADYQLKRYSLGIDAVPTGLGHAVDNSRAASMAFWFETMYQPLLVSEDGLSFGIRGQRLQIKAGAIPFEPANATPKALAWGKSMTEKMPALIESVPLFAELANVADLSLLAGLIRHDKLDSRAGLDLSWLTDGKSYKVTRIPVPRTADTLVNYAGGSVVVGGVSLAPAPWLSEKSREKDTGNTLGSPRKIGSQKR